jgi:hypothetical protein
MRSDQEPTSGLITATSRSPPHWPGSVRGVAPFFSPSTNTSAPEGVEVRRSSLLASCRTTGVNFKGAFCSRSSVTLMVRVRDW